MNHTYVGTPPKCVRCGESPNRDYNTECINKQDCDTIHTVLAKIHGMLTTCYNELPDTAKSSITLAQGHLENAIDRVDKFKESRKV